MRRKARARVATRRSVGGSATRAGAVGALQRSLLLGDVAESVEGASGRLHDDDGVRGWAFGDWATSAGAASSWRCRRQMILHVPPWFEMGAPRCLGRLLLCFARALARWRRWWWHRVVPWTRHGAFLCKGSAVCAVCGRLPHTAETVGVLVMALQRAADTGVGRLRDGGCARGRCSCHVGMPMSGGRPMDASGVMPATPADGCFGRHASDPTRTAPVSAQGSMPCTLAEAGRSRPPCSLGTEVAGHRARIERPPRTDPLLPPCTSTCQATSAQNTGYPFHAHLPPRRWGEAGL